MPGSGWSPRTTTGRPSCRGPPGIRSRCTSIPTGRRPTSPSLTPEERAAFGPLYTGVLRALDGLFGVRMPYVAAWHQAPVRWGREVAYVHMELFSIRRAAAKLKYLAGSESAMGAFVNDVSPEEAASMLRAASGKMERHITD